MKHIRVSGLFCVNDGGQGEKCGPLEDTWRVPREQQLSSLFQVAGSNGQSSPPRPPGKESLLFICAFTPLFSEGERIQLDITQPTLGLLRSCPTRWERGFPVNRISRSDFVEVLDPLVLGGLDAIPLGELGG